MNKMEQYDKALMEGTISPKRMAKKRMKAFMEAMSEVAPRELVEAVVTAHNALFEFGPMGPFAGAVHYGMTPNGVRTKTQTGNYSTKRTYNGNDLVRTNDRYQPPTSANTEWHLQNGQGSAALRHYNNVVVNDPMQRIDPREYDQRTVVNMHNVDPWEMEKQYSAPVRQAPPPPPPPPPQMAAPQAVRQGAPKPEQPKAECPPVCPAPVQKEEPHKESDVGTKTKGEPVPTKKKAPAAAYKWKDDDFHPADDPRYKGKCSTTHNFVINLFSPSKEDGAVAREKARALSLKGIQGVYTYQYDGLAQNTTREDVWRVRIGYFKSKAAARTYFRKHIFPIVGSQYNWWVGTCSGDKGDKMKPGTLRDGNEIKASECVDNSVAQKPAEQPASNTTQQSNEQPKEHTLSALLK